jgi:hypothetical protein
MASTDLVVAAPGSGCMLCLGSSSTNVWCSRTYSYLITTASTPKYQYEQTVNTYTMQAQVQTLTTESAGNYDGGSCCDTNANFITFTGKQAAAAVVTGWSKTNAQSVVDVESNGATCVAL